MLGEVTVIRNDAHDRHGDLTQPGCEQLRHIARRMVEHFPEVFEGNVVVDAKSTTRRRCILSMGSAIQQIALMRPDLHIKMDASYHDMWYLNHQDKQLRDSMMTHRAKVAFNAYCDKRENMERMMGMLFNDTAYANHEVDRWTLHYYLYKLSAVVRGTILGDNETLSSLFTAEELYQLWQRENAWWYISYGPSLLNGGKQPYVQRHLLRKIIEEADSCITEITPGATLRFGHETVMLGLSCLMGVNGLDYQTMDLEELEQHGWVSYRVFPKGCNLQLVFYRRDPFDKDVIFKVLLNEEEATLPIESSIHHSQQTVAARGREVFAQTNLFDEIEIGIKNLLWGMVAKYTDEQCHNTLHDEGVALGLEMNDISHFSCLVFHFDKVGLQPHTALTSVDEVAFHLVFLVKRFLLIT